MNDTFQRASNLAISLDGHKRLATATRLAPFPVSLVRTPLSRAEFDELVTTLYKWYWEDLREDRSYLLLEAAQADRSAVEEFEQTLNAQRHLAQHSNPDQAAYASQWRDNLAAKGADEASRCAAWSEALGVLLCRALEILNSCAYRLAINPAGRRGWLESASVSPEAQVARVYGDLGLRPAGSRFRYVVHQFTSNPRRTQTSGIHQRRQLAEVMVLGNWLQPLSLPYEEVLDEFGLIGRSDAVPLLLLAHGLEVSSGLAGQQLLEILRNVWQMVLEQRSS
jgi:hypothetical protein